MLAEFSSRLLVSALVWLAMSSSVLAGEARFRLVSAERIESLQRKLNAAAEDGFHLISAARGSSLNGKGRTVVLLERNEAPIETHEFRVLAVSGRSESLSDVSALGETGFRLISGMVLSELPDDWWVSKTDSFDQVQLILDRSDASAAYHYNVLRYESLPSFGPRLAEFMNRGYDVLGLINSDRRLRLVLERNVNSDRGNSGQAAPDHYRLIVGSVKVGLRHQLNDAAAEGYRVISIAETGTNAPPLMLVEKLAEPGRTVEYKPVYEPGQKIYNENLEQKLNKRARKGYRVTPGCINRSAVVMERTEGRARVQYRALSSRTPPGLSENLGQAARAGFRPIAMFVNGDETTVVIESGERVRD